MCGRVRDNDYAEYVERATASLRQLAAIQRCRWVKLVNGREISSPGTSRRCRIAYDRVDDGYLPVDVATELRYGRPATYRGCTVVYADDTSAELEMDRESFRPSVEVRSDSANLLECLAKRLEEIAFPGKIAKAIALCTGDDFRKGDTPVNRRDAVETVLSQPLSFVWGPPGTGKTRTLAMIAERLVRDGHNVLVVSSANVAVDEAVLKIAAMLSDMPRGAIVRYGTPRDRRIENACLSVGSIVRAESPELALRESELAEMRATAILSQGAAVEAELKDVRRRLRRRERAIGRAAILVATTLARASVDPCVYERSFDAVLFDEVGMALVPQVVFAATLASERMCCLGDFRQLPPIADDSVPELGQDVFERLGVTESVDRSESHELLVMLDEQWRCHPEIASMVGERLYGGMLRTSGETAERTVRRATEYLPGLGGAFVVDLSGMPSLALRDSSSHFNLMSASVCVTVALGMPRDWTVAIITPYRSQAEIVRAMVRDAGAYGRIRVATVHGFQGSEADAVVFDVVDCAPRDSLGGLLRDEEGRLADRLLNVAVTRARYKLAIVANLRGLRDIYPPEGLLLREVLDGAVRSGKVVAGEGVIGLAGSHDGIETYQSGSSVEAWDAFLSDVSNARREVLIVVARALAGAPVQINRLCDSLDGAAMRGARVRVCGGGVRELPPRAWRHVVRTDSMPNTALAVIDNVLWDGVPCSWLGKYAGARMSMDPAFRHEGGNSTREVGRIYRSRLERAIDLSANVQSAETIGQAQLRLEFDA